MSLSTPDPARHARFAASGLTRYSYDEIVSAAADYEASVAAHEAAVQRAWAVVEANAPHGTHWITWETMLEEPYATLHNVMSEPATYCGVAGHNRESWPIRKWQAAAKANRRLTQRILRAVAQAQQV